MGFLGGLASAVQTAGPIAANIGGDYEQAQAQGSQLRNQQALQMLMLQRQQRQAEIENALHVAQTGEAQAHGAQYQHEAQKLQPGDAGYVPMMGQLAGAQKAAEWPVIQQQLEAEHQNRLSEIQQQGGNQMAVAQEEIRSRQAMQDAQQQFTATQNAQNRAATASNQGASQASAAARIGITQSGEVVPTLVHGAQAVGHALNPANWFKAPSSPTGTTSPSASSSTAPNPQQSAWDNAAQHLQKTQPNIDPSAVLGARP